ncbi:hypothetical protein CUMW_236400 [Citrus unshiu]|uniref:Uncharacterized protein n=1 Tax=Citrus unshiu TaxID=55188 RepID=A0A2H5QJL3_CITUN|nr:hypothetical protein CUMW_236400 [Citrus unshiu]
MAVLLLRVRVWSPKPLKLHFEFPRVVSMRTCGEKVMDGCMAGTSKSNILTPDKTDGENILKHLTKKKKQFSLVFSNNCFPLDVVKQSRVHWAKKLSSSRALSAFAKQGLLNSSKMTDKRQIR